MCAGTVRVLCEGIAGELWWTHRLILEELDFGRPVVAPNGRRDMLKTIV